MLAFSKRRGDRWERDLCPNSSIRATSSTHGLEVPPTNGILHLSKSVPLKGVITLAMPLSQFVSRFHHPLVLVPPALDAFEFESDRSRKERRFRMNQSSVMDILRLSHGRIDRRLIIRSVSRPFTQRFARRARAPLVRLLTFRGRVIFLIHSSGWGCDPK